MDVVTLVESLCSDDPGRMQATVTEVGRILKPGGYVVTVLNVKSRRPWTVAQFGVAMVDSEMFDAVSYQTVFAGTTCSGEAKHVVVFVARKATSGVSGAHGRGVVDALRAAAPPGTAARGGAAGQAPQLGVLYVIVLGQECQPVMPCRGPAEILALARGQDTYAGSCRRKGAKDHEWLRNKRGKEHHALCVEGKHPSLQGAFSRAGSPGLEEFMRCMHIVQELKQQPEESLIGFAARLTQGPPGEGRSASLAGSATRAHCTPIAPRQGNSVSRTSSMTSGT